MTNQETDPPPPRSLTEGRKAKISQYLIVFAAPSPSKSTVAKKVFFTQFDGTQEPKMMNRSRREPQRNSESSHKIGILSGLCI